MFLRKTSRFKDGKRHDYWSVAENARAGSRVVQRQLLYLGEIDEDRQNAWLNAIDELEERKAEDAASYLIPPQPEQKRETSATVRIRLNKMTVENIREWGACWLGLYLWDLVGLDGFWARRLPPSSHGTDWLSVFKAIVLYRLTDPGSEWRMHREWYDRTAVRDLLGDGAFTPKSTLYSCLDRLVAHKDGMFEFLRDRWAGLFASDCRVILYDLTSTYFEVDGTKAEKSDLLRHGYSRDRRGDCLQVVIALVLTPDGLPLAYEVMPGNTSDKGTQMQFVDSLVKKYGHGGKLDSLWLMDRGVPTEETLSDMRDKGFRYLVGSPRSMVDALGKKLVGQEWTQVRDGIRVKYATDGTDKYVLTHSRERFTKEHAMRLGRMRAVLKVLHAIDVRIGRRQEFGKDGKPVERERKALSRDELIARLAVARSKAGRSWGLFRIRKPKRTEATVTKENFSWSFDLDRIRQARRDEGTYLLRTNMTDADAAVHDPGGDRAVVQGGEERPRPTARVPPARRQDRGAHLRQLRRVLPSGDAEEPDEEQGRRTHAKADIRQDEEDLHGRREDPDDGRPRDHDAALWRAEGRRRARAVATRFATACPATTQNRRQDHRGGNTVM